MAIGLEWVDFMGMSNRHRRLKLDEIVARNPGATGPVDCLVLVARLAVDSLALVWRHCRAGGGAPGGGGPRSGSAGRLIDPAADGFKRFTAACAIFAQAVYLGCGKNDEWKIPVVLTEILVGVRN